MTAIRRGLGRNAALAVQNVGDAVRRRAQREGEGVGRQATRFDLIFQILPGTGLIVLLRQR